MKCADRYVRIHDGDSKYEPPDMVAQASFTIKGDRGSNHTEEVKKPTCTVKVGKIKAGRLLFSCFKLEEDTYVSIREIVKKKMFTLKVLQEKLQTLQYRPRMAPMLVDLHFKGERLGVEQTLWVDLPTVRMLCFGEEEMLKLNNTLQSIFAQRRYEIEIEVEIMTVDDAPIPEKQPFTLDSKTLQVVFTSTTGIIKGPSRDNTDASNMPKEFRSSRFPNAYNRTSQTNSYNKTFPQSNQERKYFDRKSAQVPRYVKKKYEMDDFESVETLEDSGSDLNTVQSIGKTLPSKHVSQTQTFSTNHVTVDKCFSKNIKTGLKPGVYLLPPTADVSDLLSADSCNDVAGVKDVTKQYGHLTSKNTAPDDNVPLPSQAPESTHLMGKGDSNLEQTGSSLIDINITSVDTSQQSKPVNTNQQPSRFKRKIKRNPKLKDKSDTAETKLPNEEELAPTTMKGRTHFDIDVEDENMDDEEEVHKKKDTQTSKPKRKRGRPPKVSLQLDSETKPPTSVSDELPLHMEVEEVSTRHRDFDSPSPIDLLDPSECEQEVNEDQVAVNALVQEENISEIDELDAFNDSDDEDIVDNNENVNHNALPENSSYDCQDLNLSDNSISSPLKSLRKDQSVLEDSSKSLPSSKIDAEQDNADHVTSEDVPDICETGGDHITSEYHPPIEALVTDQIIVSPVKTSASENATEKQPHLSNNISESVSLDANDQEMSDNPMSPGQSEIPTSLSQCNNISNPKEENVIISPVKSPIKGGTTDNKSTPKKVDRDIVAESPTVKDTTHVSNVSEDIKLMNVNITPLKKTITIIPPKSSVNVAPKKSTVTITQIKTNVSPVKKPITTSPRKSNITISPLHKTITITRRKENVVPTSSKNNLDKDASSSSTNGDKDIDSMQSNQKENSTLKETESGKSSCINPTSESTDSSTHDKQPSIHKIITPIKLFRNSSTEGKQGSPVPGGFIIKRKQKAGDSGITTDVEVATEDESQTEDEGGDDCVITHAERGR